VQLIHDIREKDTGGTEVMEQPAITAFIGIGVVPWQTVSSNAATQM